MPPPPDATAVKVNEVFWHSFEHSDEVLAKLSSSRDGLTNEEVARRFEQYGKNALTPPKKPSFFVKLWLQMNNVMIWILLSSCIIVAALQQWIEMGGSQGAEFHVRCPA